MHVSGLNSGLDARISAFDFLHFFDNELYFEINVDRVISLDFL